MGVLRRVQKEGGSPGSMPAGMEHAELALFPAVREFLFSTRWDDTGDARVPGTVLLFADATGLKVCLNDKDGDRVAFAVLSPAETVLEALEGLLLSETTDWRAVRPRGGANRK